MTNRSTRTSFRWPRAVSGPKARNWVTKQSRWWGWTRFVCTCHLAGPDWTVHSQVLQSWLYSRRWHPAGGCLVSL